MSKEKEYNKKYNKIAYQERKKKKLDPNYIIKMYSAKKDKNKLNEL